MLLSGAPASAQRTSERMAFFGVSPMVTAYGVPSGGIAVDGGRYLLSSYWKAGVAAADYNQFYNDGGDPEGRPCFDHIHAVLFGDWMRRLAGTYSRSLSLYAGGGVFLGYNRYEVFRPLPDERSAGLPEGEFIYGVKAAAELECFLGGRCALVLGVHVPVTFSSSLSSDICHLTGSLGLRINL